LKDLIEAKAESWFIPNKGKKCLDGGGIDMTQKIVNYIKLIENKLEKKSELQKSEKVR
jgi:hypothetical protein